jgi:hypothetical protein
MAERFKKKLTRSDPYATVAPVWFGTMHKDSRVLEESAANPLPIIPLF